MELKLAQHLSDEEQLESLKRWWKENGTQLLVIVVLVIGGWFGWQQWTDSRETKAANASAIYIELMELAGQDPVEELSVDDRKQIQALAESLRVDYEGSHYAQYAGLMQARLAIGDGDLDAAKQALESVIEGSDDAELADIARLRLARVEIAGSNYSAALEALDAEVPAAMTALFAELRGDIYYYLEDYPAARAAYQAALNSLSPGEDDVLLGLKLNRVRDVEPVTTAAAEEIAP